MAVCLAVHLNWGALFIVANCPAGLSHWSLRKVRLHGVNFSGR